MNPPPTRWFSTFVQKLCNLLYTQTGCKITTYESRKRQGRKQKINSCWDIHYTAIIHCTADTLFILLINDKRAAMPSPFCCAAGAIFQFGLSILYFCWNSSWYRTSSVKWKLKFWRRKRMYFDLCASNVVLMRFFCCCCWEMSLW